jgi:hypothetical protein
LLRFQRSQKLSASVVLLKLAAQLRVLVLQVGPCPRLQAQACSTTAVFV